VPTYGYNNNQALLASQQWGQQGGGQAYDLSYQAYPAADPGPFQQHHQGYDADADYGEEFYEDEEPRRGKRWLLIVVALVGAIGVGGALAYTYKSLIAPHAGRVPLVRAEPNVKVKPEPKKLPSRAEETASAAHDSDASQEAATENMGPRSVKTIPIAPGTAQPAPASVTPSIPGITLYQPPGQPQPEAQPMAPAPTPTVQPPPAVQPKVVLPPPAARASAPEQDDDEPLPSVKRPPAQSPPPAARPAPRPPSSGLGYVAVLSSQKSSMDALKVFADLQQKYGDILDDKAPDVQEADLSDRGLGMMYRLVVGPPGSKNAALGVCQQLKSAGYQGCWVKEY
jgi:cytoskeletal protein RodZ